MAKKTFLQRKYYRKQAELFGFDMIEDAKHKFNVFYEMRSQKNSKKSEKYYKQQSIYKEKLETLNS